MKIGQTANAKEIGYAGTAKFIWDACPDCGKERWVPFPQQGKKCQHCACPARGRSMEKHPMWRGGTTTAAGKYKLVKLAHTDPYYPMANKRGYAFEHRLIMARHLGRCLKSWEVVHHKNHNPQDNMLENLYLMSLDDHTALTILERRVKALEEEVKQLKAERTIRR